MARRYIISPEGNFYKAQLHTHSTVSDGALTPEEVKELYKIADIPSLPLPTIPVLYATTI